MNLSNLMPGESRKKISRLLCVTALSTCSVFAYAQQQQVKLTGSNLPLKSVFKQIEKQTDLSIDYRSQDVDDSRIVKQMPKVTTVQQAMNQLLAGTDCVVTFSNGHIIIKKQASNTTNQQSKLVKGTIVDATGMPVIGANVMVKGTTNGTISDMDGKFSLEADNNAILVVSYIGFANQEIKVGNQTNLSITMKEDAEALDELVVVGYGTQTKSSLSSSIVEIKGDKLTNLPITSISRAIDSYVPGVTVSGTMAERPGESQALRIRGENSINNSDPLVLVDGIEGDMNLVNPNDIESISVLKDAASTAIYGARAAGGVILITTKKGEKDQKIRINYAGSYTNKSATRLPKMLDGLSYVENRIKAEEAAGMNTQFNHPDVLAALKDPSVTEIPDPARPLTHFVGTASVDHVAELFNSASLHDHNLSITGGNKKLSFLVSGSFTQDDALFSCGDFGFTKYNLRSNLDFEFTDRISLSTKINYSNSKIDQPVNGWDQEIWQAYFTHPNDPIKWSTGDWGGNNGGNVFHDLTEGGHSITKHDRLDISGNLQVEFMDGLLWNTIIGGSLVNTNLTQEYKTILRYSVQPDVVIGKAHFPNSLNRQATRKLYRNIQSYLTYNKTLSTHDLRVMLGASYEDSGTDVFFGKRQEYLSNDMMNSLDLGVGDQYSGGDLTEWGISSIFGRFNYNYNQKYFLEASFRSDASSRFVKGKRWGFFPSVSASWRISEESFMKNQNILSDLKLRASWGNTGNQNSIGLYDYIAQLKVGGYYPFGITNSQDRFVKQDNLASIERSWERLEVKNIALDYGFLDNRLTGSFEYYIKNNRNMLIPVDLPSVIGMSVPTFNAGELKVWGWEAMLRWQDRVNDKFSYEVNFSIQDSNNKIIKFEGSKNIISGQQNIEGYPIGSYFGYETDGLFQSKEEVEDHAFQHIKNDAGDVKYIDQNGDHQINDKDLVYLGNIRPRYVYNLGIRMSYLGFDMEMLFDGVGKKIINLNTDLAAPVSYARFEGQTDAWTPDNPNSEWPRVYYNAGWNWWISDRTLHNAAYFSMKNFQLGYTFPQQWLEKIFVDRLRLYVNVRNPFIIDNYVEYLDPRLNGYNNYPVLRSYTIGLNVTF